jgi:hypothetical protein
MTRNLAAATARATMNAARATVAGATRTTATATRMTTMTVATVATMMPNGNEDNEDGNSKNNDKATRTPTSTTEGEERCQSRRDNGVVLNRRHGMSRMAICVSGQRQKLWRLPGG